MSGWGYIFRILKGESPSDVLASMPKKDYDKVDSVVNNLNNTNLNIPKYNWLVHIFYHVTCYWTDEIMDCLKSIGCPPQKLKESYRNLEACKLNTGLTYSNYHLRESVMVIGKTSSSEEFSDSLMHELRHLEDHIAIVYKMPAGGEEIAYLAGYIGRKLSKDIQMFICSCDCHKHQKKRLCEKKTRKYRS